MVVMELLFIILLADVCNAVKRGRGCGCKHVLGHTLEHRICKEKCRLRRHYLFDLPENPQVVSSTKNPKCEKCENLRGRRQHDCEVEFCGG